MTINAPREEVWAFVIDPEQVGACGPGVETVERLDDLTFRAIARVGIGMFRARFAVDAEMVEQEEPERAVIKARAQAPGSAVEATATMRLHEEGDGTTMVWAADVVVGGTVASIGARLLEGTANKMIAQTFDCIRSRLES